VLLPLVSAVQYEILLDIFDDAGTSSNIHVVYQTSHYRRRVNTNVYFVEYYKILESEADLDVKVLYRM
jgi:hypothetical protein